MPPPHSLFPLFLALGTLFGALAAAGAYLISYAEYRRHRLRPGQDPKRMALGMAGVAFAFFFVAALVLSIVLPLVLRRTGP